MNQSFLKGNTMNQFDLTKNFQKKTIFDDLINKILRKIRFFNVDI